VGDATAVLFQALDVDGLTGPIVSLPIGAGLVDETCRPSVLDEGPFSLCGPGLVCGGSRCEAGPPPFVCDTGVAHVIAATDVPRLLPDVGSVTSDIVPGISGVVDDVVVIIDALDHGFVPDLSLALVARDVTIPLASFPSPGSNLRQLVIDERCTTRLSAGRAPWTGCFRPLTSLVALRGEPVPARVGLLIRDDVAADAGVLRGWRLGLCVR